MTEPDILVRGDTSTAKRERPSGTSEQLVLDEAWAIAIDLRRDLGLSEAIAWADAYLEEVRERQCSSAAARWVVVINALAELSRSSGH